MGNESYDVFVSYSRADWRHAADIDSVLRDKGLKTFFDRRNLAPGLPWVRALEQAIGASKAATVLIGPRGFGNTQQYERDLALVRQTQDRAFPVVPVILPGTTTDPPFDFLRVLTWIDFAHVSRVSDAPDVLEHLLTAVRGVQAPAEAEREAICPYRGLDAFREEDSAFFFGRGSADDPESPIAQLVRKVREQPFVMVVGRSGSGKSSLIFAGLLPALRRERDRFWNVLSLRPGPTPLRALAERFNPRAEDEGAAEYATKIGNEADKLRTGDPELLAHMIRQELDQAEGKPDRLLLYIDQWEELYAQAQHAADVNHFINLLLTAARSAPVTVVGTVRADFYDPLIAHQELRALLPTRQILLAPMSYSELERTIVEPAKKVGLAFDPPGLVRQILDEAGEDEGMLPLLQYALKESWALRKGNTITGDSYARSGGVREAIRLTAERTFNALSPSDQQVARQLFLRLVTPGEGQEDTRARAAMPVDQAQRKIVEQFSAQRTRLLVTGFDRAARPTVEVAHEALIRTWPRLRQWIDENRDKLRSRAAILQAKAEWEQHGQREDLLLPKGFQLNRARALLKEPGDLTVDDIQEFITLSSAREENERKQREAEEAPQRVQRIRRRTLTAVGAVLLLSIFPLSSLIFQQYQKRYVIPAREEAWNAILKSPTASASEKSEAIRGLARNDLSLNLTNTTLDDVAVDGIEAQGAKFIQVHLNNVSFERSSLANANFSQSLIVGGKFNKTSLELARFDGAMIADTSFSNANLYRSIFDRALFCRNVQFSLSDIRSASFLYVTFDGGHVPQFNGTAWWLALGWSMQQVQSLAAQSSGVDYKDTPAFKNEMQYYENWLSTAPEPTLARAIALNGKAWALATYGIDLADAERLSQEALTIVRRSAEKSSSVVREEANEMDTLAYIQMQTGKMSEGLENLKAAVQKVQGQEAVLFRYALAQFATGQRDEAIRNLVLAVDSGKYVPSHEMYLLRQHIKGEFLTNLETLMSKNLPISAPPPATCPANSPG